MSPGGVARAGSLMLLLLLAGCGGSTPSPESPEEQALVAAEGRGDERTALPTAELTAHEVVIKLRGNETDIRRCFFANPSARGTLSLSWRVNTEGRIERLKRERSTLSDPRIEQCLG